MEREIIEQVQSYGFHVYMRVEADSWMIYTSEDGKQLGYLQVERFGGISISTVHIPNSTSGTGYQIERHVDSFDKAALEAGFTLKPHWARGDFTPAKWRDIEHFKASNRFNGDYQLVPLPTPPTTETRYVAAMVRQEHAQGNFGRKVFKVDGVTVTGSHDQTMAELIKGIRAQGYETRNILGHSTKKDCV